MYITFYKNTPPRQITFEDYYNNFGQELQEPEPLSPFPRKITVWNPNFNTERQHLAQMETALKNLEPKITTVLQLMNGDPQNMYNTFFIPKRKGGLRKIDAPKYELMELLSEIKTVFERDLRVLAHDTAFAYIPQRSTKEALMEHQKNQSKWFLKIDLKDFFPSCTTEIIENAFDKVFPFAALHDPLILLIRAKLIQCCLLNGGLPQGTPMSPILTNIIMVPYDFTIQNTLRNFDNKHFVYTRYADDLLISCRYHFDWRQVQEKLQELLQPFQINTLKTRYGSSAGSNWNLGLMLNKDNNITIGHKKKERFRAAVFQFMTDFTEGHPWSIIDTQGLMGLHSYYHKIEPEFVEGTIQKYEEKFPQTRFRAAVKTILG